MFKALLYKEWTKTKWYLLLSAIFACGFSAYTVFRIIKAISLQGAAHLWEVMLLKDAVFIDRMTYIPLLTAIALGFFQFIPEMQKKCLKLSLHLPYPTEKMTSVMIIYGTAVLTAIYAIINATLFIALEAYFAFEMNMRIFLTSLPWYIAGYVGYYFTAWTILEPTWKRRIPEMAVSLLIIKIAFLSQTPEAYNGFLAIMIVFTILCSSLVHTSIDRFKAGKQD